MNEMVARLDDFGIAAWIAVMVAGFVVFWPLGLAILAYLWWSGRMGMGCNGRRSNSMTRWQQRMADKWQQSKHEWSDHARGAASSGNRAFDEYRDETLRRLEEEQRAFREFLSKLRMAKDRSEFDAFMADRRRDAAGPSPGSAG